jgi:uncharacterized protein YndB with AHSA1/START domain
MYIAITIIAILILIPLIGAAFLSNEYVIEREITINKSNAEVFEYIKFLKNQEQYNKWVMRDPNQKTELRGTDGTVGFVMAWDSQDKGAGKGEQEIMSMAEGKRIDYEIRFEKPFKNVAGSYFITEPISAGQTKVKWAFTGTRPYGMKVMHFALNLPKMLGKDLQASLGNLKGVLET